jgi:hypothetical protein
VQWALETHFTAEEGTLEEKIRSFIHRPTKAMASFVQRRSKRWNVVQFRDGQARRHAGGAITSALVSARLRRRGSWRGRGGWRVYPFALAVSLFFL